MCTCFECTFEIFFKQINFVFFSKFFLPVLDQYFRMNLSLHLRFYYTSSHTEEVKNSQSVL